ncbi:thiamine pyrophosphate [Methanoculleus bourgensis MS2]|uniref:sulfopyruvate decarboxylase n=1 Tax=Methanoculleus bourgensis (strain ATCC 43281 / DSM 3045 / OCM 15 / MS2) TaxID=1201294 RepID=I7LL16_METBM|nr:sulfopyruvate decarboxylase subunit beta [Methanoculleus bourgensis]CCJ34979.1 thiamine pyrophosphate [Methanoculleus bourgensis MS2]
MREGCVLDRLAALGVDTVASLPCDRTRDLCALIPERFHAVNLTREEDGVGICAGLAMAGGRPVLHMQSSGLGNSLNAIMSLTVTFGLPLPILASWRGVYREAIPAQVPFNRAVPEVLAALGIPFTIIRDPGDEELIDTVVRDAYDAMRPHVGLILPSFWEGEEACLPERVFPSRARESALAYRRTFRDPVMTRYDAIRVIAAALDGEAVVANIGVPSKELYAANDRDLNFYMLGSYTQATPIGLGIGLATDRDVVVLDGDGSLLGTAVLPVVAEQAPENLTIVCLDNGAFGSTGNQPTPASGLVDMELLALAAGIRKTCKVQDEKELKEAWESRGRGPTFIHVVLKPGNAKVPNIPLTPGEIRERFVRALGR